MGHTLIRNRTTGAVWPCPDGVLEAALDSDDPFLGSSWVRAGKDAEPSAEQPESAGTVVTSGTTTKGK